MCPPGTLEYRIDIDLTAACTPAKSTSYSRISSNTVYYVPAGSDPEEIKVYPNPADEQITIALQGSAVFSDSMTLAVYDVVGRELIQLVPPVNQQQVTIQIGHWEPGAYLVVLMEQGGERKTAKLTVQR